MKLRDIVIAIIALVLAYIFINILWFILFQFIKLSIILLSAYIIYLILKKLL